MSAYTEHETTFKDPQLLMQCLTDLGFVPEYHAQGKHLTGYHGDRRPEIAEIVIPRKQIGHASNDIGFKLGTDGKFRAIVSEYDSHRHGSQWQGKLASAYAQKGILQEFAKKGFRAIGTKKVIVNGRPTTQLQFIKA